MPLDPSEQADFLQLLTGLEAADFDQGPAFEPEVVVSVRHGAASATTLRFGREERGLRPVARFDETAFGHVRGGDLTFLERPYWGLLARQAYSAAWFSLASIEVEEVGRRKAVVTAVSTAGEGPDFVLAGPQGAEARRVPAEVAAPVADKISFLTVDEFVAHGDPEAFGLDQPAYRITWFDSAKSQGVAPDSRSGQRITWTVGPRGSDGRNHGMISIAPGLVFKTSARDLDPFISLLEWAR
jgi:hypothetical protein